MTAALHGVTPEEVIADAQAFLNEIWTTQDSENKDFADLFPSGKPSPEEIIFVVSSRAKEDIRKELENGQLAENNTFPDEIDNF